jgi:hypothetical protein
MAETHAPRTQRTRHARRIGLLVGCPALMVVVGAAAVTYGSADPYGAYVDFVPSVSYAAALRTITSLGLQTALPGGASKGLQAA